MDSYELNLENHTWSCPTHCLAKVLWTGQTKNCFRPSVCNLVRHVISTWLLKGSCPPGYYLDICCSWAPWYLFLSGPLIFFFGGVGMVFVYIPIIMTLFLLSLCPIHAPAVFPPHQFLMMGPLLHFLMKNAVLFIHMKMFHGPISYKDFFMFRLLPLCHTSCFYRTIHCLAKVLWSGQTKNCLSVCQSVCLCPAYLTSDM